jgi:thiaminase/transcriptional activator TenA
VNRFTDRMWDEIAPLYRQVLDLPFNHRLAHGTLERDVFLHYMMQDAHYLGAFSRALALIAAKAPNPDAQIKFAKGAHDAIVVERSLHEDFFRTFGVSAEMFAATRPSPTCAAYGHFLIATAFGQPFGVGVAAILPCFQIYWEVGKELYRISSDDNPYRRWIDTYADEAFGDSVVEVLAFADAAHDAASAIERGAMRDAYLTACRYEWMFWDAAWRREAWPV